MSVREERDRELIKAVRALGPRYVAIKSSGGRRIVAGVGATSAGAWGSIDNGRAPASCVWAKDPVGHWRRIAADGLGAKHEH